MLSVNLNSPTLPGPRLRAVAGVTMVPAFTDLKLHDITGGPDDPEREPLDMLQAAGSAPFFDGNGRFLTKRLWGIANEPPFFHHGKFTTMRDVIVNHHHGEALASHDAFVALSDYDQDSIIEFLKTLRCCAENKGAHRGRTRREETLATELERSRPLTAAASELAVANDRGTA